MEYIQYLSIYDVSSMLYAGELAKSSSGSMNFMGESRTISGVPIGGVRNVLRNYMHDMFQHTAVLLVFDSKTDKQKLFSEYKSTRERMPKIYVQQLLLLDVVKRLGLPFMKVDSFEADDLIHAAVMHYFPYVGNMSIYSGDTDIAANLIKDQITFRGTASIYPTFDMHNYSQNIKKGCVIPYNAILPYYMFFGKASNNVPAFSSTGTNKELFNQFLEFCTNSGITAGMWSDSSTFAAWLLNCMEQGSLAKDVIEKLFTRMSYVFPKPYEGEIPETFKYLDDLNRDDLAFFLKMFNMDTLMQNLQMDNLILAPKTPAMYSFIDQYKIIYQDGCLAVDNDMSPDDSLFSGLEQETTVFDAEDF